MAVECRHDGGCFAGDVDQDCRGGATILRPVINAGEHNERPDRIDTEGDRQQHGDRCNRPDAGQHTDQGADQATEETKPEVLQGERDAEAERQIDIRSNVTSGPSTREGAHQRREKPAITSLAPA